MLIYVLRWRPSWISNRHKKHKICRGPSNDHSCVFFSETTNIIKAKMYMNVHWVVLYKLYVFCSDMKFKMAATAGLSLTFDPMGKMLQNTSSRSNVKLSPAVAAILNFIPEQKT
jgi:hypothetical protein